MEIWNLCIFCTELPVGINNYLYRTIPHKIIRLVRSHAKAECFLGCGIWYSSPIMFLNCVQTILTQNKLFKLRTRYIVCNGKTILAIGFKVSVPVPEGHVKCLYSIDSYHLYFYLLNNVQAKVDYMVTSRKSTEQLI